MNKQIVTATQHVQSSWGESAPQWLKDFAQACDESSQADMAKKIGKSAALVNQLLKNKYPGRVDRVQFDIERVLSKSGVTCPIQGNIDYPTCLNNQKLPYDGSNHARVQLFKACRTCPHNAKNKGD